MNPNRSPEENERKVSENVEDDDKCKEDPPKKKKKKQYPLLPYLIGLFVMVVVLVMLSYLMQLRNRQELKIPASAAYTVQMTDEAALQQ